MASILLIDDHPDLREVIRELLQLHGHIVQCCANGEDALLRLTEEIPDVVIVDENLPGMSGMQVLERIRRDPTLDVVKVILCSAEDSKREVAQQAGAMEFWLKSSDELFDAVERLDATLKTAV